MKWPYKLLLIAGLITSAVFAASPYFFAHSLSETVKKKDMGTWRKLVKTDYMTEYATHLMDGMLRLKMAIDTRNPMIGRGMAMQDFTFARGMVQRKSTKMSTPEGFGHLLCGEVARFPDFPEKHDSDCWTLDGHLQWQSLNKVVVSYKNPESGWHTNLYLQRISLFDWQVVDIKLPVDEMLTQLKTQLLES